MIQLHPVTHGPRKNRYCGPAALSALTGLPTDTTSELLRRVTGKRAITGVGDEVMIKTLHRLGFVLTRADRYERSRPTLAAWLEGDRMKRPASNTYLVSAGNHWQVIQGDLYVCGQSLSITTVDNKFRVKRRARVRATYIVRQATPEGMAK